MMTQLAIYGGMAFAVGQFGVRTGRYGTPSLALFVGGFIAIWAGAVGAMNA